ncbi:MAG: energy transducer TonB [Planctomycetota bacterium]|nr:MAG: energy transducer TonB [Planctomycetota bacterium]
MKLSWPLGIFGAVMLHAGMLLFGGLLFPGAKEGPEALAEVELLGADAAPEKDKEPDQPEPASEEAEELEAEAEEAPDAAEILRNLERPASIDAPALEAASLAAIEQALNGPGGGGDFAAALSFASGGRIGGTGDAGALDQTLGSAFSLAEIDQKPRAVFQATALYPAEMRGKRLEGLVSVIFVVDASGKVTQQRVEKSSHPAFEKPALDAVKQWRFEPAVKAGQRVPCKMRVPIRFQPS